MACLRQPDYELSLDFTNAGIKDATVEMLARGLAVLDNLERVALWLCGIRHPICLRGSRLQSHPT